MAPGPSEMDSVQERARRLGADLRRRRLTAGLTQRALAARIGYDRSYLSQVETGAQVPAEQFIPLSERELAAGASCSACSTSCWWNEKPAGRRHMLSDGAQTPVAA